MSLAKSPLDELRIERRPEPPSRSNPWPVIIVILVILLLVVLFFWHTRSGGIEVQTAVARLVAAGDNGRTVLNASGYVTARRAATVSSKVTGKVVEVLFEEGLKVTEGQVLARLDDTNVRTSLDVAQAQLDSAKAALAETQAQLKNADREFKRDTDLVAQHVASQADLDQAEATATALSAHLAQQNLDIVVADRQLALWKQQLDDLVIRAPFAGVITTKDAQPGEMISPVSAGGGFTRTGIGTIVDMKSLEIEIDVNESYINRVEAGQAVEAVLDAYPEWKVPCKVIAIIPTADRQKSTVKVRVAFDQLDSRILPEMSVKVAFQNAGGNNTVRTVLVPKASVRSVDGHDVVFEVQNGRAERRAVTVTDTQGDDAVLSAGVDAGEHVIVNDPPGLADGVAVKDKNL